jgi:sensor histidine kinase YesM
MPISKKGILDLTNYNLNREKYIRLDGEWEFYWKTLLDNNQLESINTGRIVTVPQAWNQSILKDESFPSKGYGTYKLRVKTSLPVKTKLGLRVYAFSSAYKLYIDEELIGTNGHVAKEPLEEVAEYKPQQLFFEIPAKTFDIIIQVSNYHHSTGGFKYSLYIGNQDSIHSLGNKIMAREFLLIGTLFIIALFYITLYSLHKEQKYTLYFALMCIFTIFGIDLIELMFVLQLFPSINFNGFMFLLYTIIMWCVFWLILFVSELYPSKFSWWIIRLYALYGIISQIMYIITLPIYYSKFDFITNCCQLLGILSTIVIVGIGIKKGHKEGWLNIISMCVFLIISTFDLIDKTNSNNYNIGQINFVGLLIFIYIQILIQAIRFREYYDNKTTAELALLQAQIKPHFLFNALNTIISISYYDIEKSRELLEQFSKYLRRSFDFKSRSQLVSLKNELDLAKAYVEIEKARFEERLEVKFDVDANLDTRVPILILQPLIENAIIHGILPKLKGGWVLVSIHTENNKLLFSIEDNGVGLTKDHLMETGEKDEKTKIGICNIDNRLKELFGKGLTIEGCKNKGTHITWNIPIRRRD